MTRYRYPGREQFEDMVTECRNLDIAALLAPQITLRQEIIGNDEFNDRGGSDDPTLEHVLKHILRIDRTRRRLTYLRKEDVGNEGLEIEKDLSYLSPLPPKYPVVVRQTQGQSTAITPLPWRFDGTDPNIPLRSEINLKSPMAATILMHVDAGIVGTSRLLSHDRSHSITLGDSMRMYQTLIGFLNFCRSTLGDDNRTDVVQLLPSDEPRGPQVSTNRIQREENQQPPQRG